MQRLQCLGCSNKERVNLYIIMHLSQNYNTQEKQEEAGTAQ